MISENIISLLNYRIQQEEASSRLYLAMGQWLQRFGYLGAASAWLKSAEEEASHAKWAYDYLQSLSILPEIPALPRPKQDFQGLPEIIEDTYQHEVIITKQCNDLAKACLDESDHLTIQLAYKYLAEQVEEMDRVNTYMDLLAVYGRESELSLALLDKELSKYGK